MAFRCERQWPHSRVSGVAVLQHTRAGNEVSGRRAEAVVDRGDINNVRRGPVVGPPTAVAERRATMSTTRSDVRPPIRRSRCSHY